MHFAIESAKKHKSTFAMMVDLINIFRSARFQENGEYIVKNLKYTDFFNLQPLASSLDKEKK